MHLGRRSSISSKRSIHFRKKLQRIFLRYLFLCRRVLLASELSVAFLDFAYTGLGPGTLLCFLFRQTLLIACICGQGVFSSHYTRVVRHASRP